jgi:heme-degrading monooxygenase HmoA
MYARLTYITLEPGLRPAGEKMASQFSFFLQTLKGFQKVLFLTDDTVGEYVVMTFWDSKENSEGAAEQVRPKIEEVMKGILKKPIETHLYELYMPER